MTRNTLTRRIITFAQFLFMAILLFSPGCTFSPVSFQNETVFISSRFICAPQTLKKTDALTAGSKHEIITHMSSFNNEIQAFLDDPRYGVRYTLDSVINRIPWYSIQKNGTFDTSFQKLWIHAVYTVDKLPYQLTVKDSSAERKMTLSASFSVTPLCKGTVQWIYQHKAPSLFDSLSMLLTYTIQGNDTINELSIIKKKSASGPVSFTKALLKSRKNSTTIHHSAAYIIPELDSIIVQSQEHALTVKNVRQRSSNCGYYSFLLPLSIVNDTGGMEKEFDYFRLYANRLLTFMNSSVSDSAKKITATACLQKLTLDSIKKLDGKPGFSFNAASDFSTKLTADSLRTFLDQNRLTPLTPYQTILKDVFELQKRRNRFYTAADSIIGNGAEVPPQCLDIDRIPCSESFTIPVQVKNLKIE